MKLVDNYIKLKAQVSEKEASLREYLLKSKRSIEELESSIEEFQNSMRKGNGFAQLISSRYEDQLRNLRSEVLQKSCQKKGDLEKSKRELEVLTEKDPLLKSLEPYTQVLPKEVFTQSLLKVVEAHKNNSIGNDHLEKAKAVSVKFKEVTLGDSKYMVKDSRKNYSDMIIFNQDNKILFVKRNKEDEFEPGKYSLPGGHIEPAENPLLAAVREVEEEIGITLDKRTVSPAGVYEDKDSVINYFCTKIDDTLINIILEERELQQYEWVEVDQIPKLDLLMNLKENFESIIEIPSVLLKNTVDSEDIALFYGLSINNVPGTGYPI